MPRLPEPAPVALSFRFLAEITSGATTCVDLCRSIGPHREGELLAVKRLLPHLAEDEQETGRFLDEVRIATAIEHPNVVKVAGWGTDEEGMYLAFELVQGVSLARLIKTVFDTGEIFPERLIAHIGAAICGGLAATHGLRSPDGEPLNLVHRDLTPANVLIGFQGEVKIADFGLASPATRATKTPPGTRRGEVVYVAPEQASGAYADKRADLFSLGVLLFELIAGRPPWSAPTDQELARAVAMQPPADLRELRPKVDRELAAIVARCIEKDRTARFQSAEEVRAQLDGWLHDHGHCEGNSEALGRFVRRNAMRQMRWFERAISGSLTSLGDISRPSLTGTMGMPRPPWLELASVDRKEETSVDPHLGKAAARSTIPSSEDVTELDAPMVTLSTSLHAATPTLPAGEAMPFSRMAPLGEPPRPSDASDQMPTLVKEGPRSGGEARDGLPPAQGDVATPAMPETPAELEVQLHAEADRLTAEAIRLREEARVAVAHAERKLAAASVAAHLASMAAEALRVSVSAGAPRASRHLADALALEQAMHRALAAPLALAPDLGTGPISSGHELQSILAQLGLEHLRVPSPAIAGTTQQGAGPGRPAGAPPSPPAPPPAIELPVAGHAAVPPSAAAPSGVDVSTLDAAELAASIRPTLLGMPRVVAVAVAATLFTAFIVLAWYLS